MPVRNGHDVEPGLALFTRDGSAIGYVKEVRGDTFKVDAPWRMDYWLRTSDVGRTIDHERAILRFDRDDLGHRRVPEREVRERFGYLAPRYGDFDDESAPVWGDPDDNGPRYGAPSNRSGYPRRLSRAGMAPEPRHPMRDRDPFVESDVYRRYTASDRATGRGPYDYDEWDETPWGWDLDLRDRDRYRRVAGPHAGRGPRGYQRSDQAIFEDVCMRLTYDPEIYACDIEVVVNDGVVTLNGAVLTRYEKRRAENIILEVPGVKDVQNALAVNPAVETNS